MMRNWRRVARGTVGLALLGCLSGCGGGSSSSSGGGGTGGNGGGTPPPPSNLTITTAQLLPGALNGQAYTTMLSATGGSGALTWMIAPVSSTTLFTTGLTIDATTGVISGTASFQGTGGFIAKVTDATSHTASQGFTITAYAPLLTASPQAFTLQQYVDSQVPLMTNTVVTGGVQPLQFVLSSPCLPAGERIDATTGLVWGSPMAIGTFVCNVTVRDSFFTPEVVTGQFTLNVTAPPLSVANSMPRTMLLNRPYSGKVIAVGGVPPYHFSAGSGSEPPGLSSVDPSGGQINGTPNTLGSFVFTVNVRDSSVSPGSASTVFYVTVAPPIGRNDTPATATPLDNGSILASISPYIDPPDGAPLPSDSDYYKVVSVGGATVHVLMESRTPTMEPALAIVNTSDSPYNTCRQAGDTSANFSSMCVNNVLTEELSGIDATLDFQVPGAPNAVTTFYVHALDWKGIARPDNVYQLSINGVVDPLAIQSTKFQPAARGFSYSQQMSAANGTGNITWSVTSGSLPPGLSIVSGSITGTPTTDGTYPFTVQASDSGTPPQTASAPESIQVGEPVKITTSPALPDACLNQPYSFTFKSTGGIPPIQWLFSGFEVGIGFDQSTGVFSGTPLSTGTFTDSVFVGDATAHGDTQQFTYTVKQCP